MRDLGVLVAVVLPALDLGLLAHHLHEEDHRDGHAGGDGSDQVEHNGEDEREEQRRHGTLRCGAAQVREVAPAAHVVGHLQQDGGDGGHGDERGIGHEENENQKQHDGVHHAGDGRAATALDVGGRAGDGARGGDAAEQDRADVAHTLGHELHIAAMVGRDHGVGHDARKQGLNGCQDGDGDAVGQLVAEKLEAELGRLELRETGLDGVEVADGVHVHAEERHHDGSDDDGDKRAGDLVVDARPQDENGQAHKAHEQGLPVKGGDVGGHGGELVGGVDGDRAGRVGKAQEILDLADDDGDGDAGGEAGGDGVGHEADERTEFEQAHQDENHAGNKRGGHKALEAVGGHNTCNDSCKRGRGTRNLHARATKHGNEEASDDGRVDAALRAHARGDGKRDGERQRHDRHDDARDDVLRDLAAQFLLAGMLDDAEQNRFNFVALHGPGFFSNGYK